MKPWEALEGSPGFQGPKESVPRRDSRRLVLTISLRNSASAASRLGGLVRIPAARAPPPPAPPRQVFEIGPHIAKASSNSMQQRLS